MNDTSTLASSRYQPARPGTLMEPADRSSRGIRLATLQSLIASWGERIRFRRQLEHKLKGAPHLIEDMGLTRGQAEAEIAKPFWRR